MMQHSGDWACGPLMKALAFAVLWPGCWWRLSRKKLQAAHSLAFNKTFNATDSLFNSPVCEAVYCIFWSLLALWVNGYYGRTNKEKIDDYRRWNLKLKLKWGPKTHLQLPIITIGAVKENEMKIFKILTLSKSTNVIGKTCQSIKVKILLMEAEWTLSVLYCYVL